MRTNSGRDWLSRIMGDTASSGSGAYAPATYVGLTADVTTPIATDTTLTAELTGGTMLRSQATYSHTNGSASYTLTRTFTADRTVTVFKIGVFTDPSIGTMAFETVLDTPATMKSGDTIQIIESVTL